MSQPSRWERQPRLKPSPRRHQARGSRRGHNGRHSYCRIGQNVARQVSLGAGMPITTPAYTINIVCGSGLKTVMLAAQAIQCGDADIIVAGGAENMSASPHLAPSARNGYRMGPVQLLDSMITDGLTDVFSGQHMGMTARTSQPSTASPAKTRTSLPAPARTSLRRPSRRAASRMRSFPFRLRSGRARPWSLNRTSIPTSALRWSLSPS